MIELALLLGAAALSAEPGFHTPPECWPSPRYSHRPATDEFTDRVSLQPAPRYTPFEGEFSPNRGYQFQHQGAEGSTELRIDVERGRQWLLRLRGAAWQPEARWVNEKLLFVRVHWGRIQASDLLIDVEQAQVLLHELADNGEIAYQQFQQACGGRCPCQAEAEISPSLSLPEPLSAAPLLGLGEIVGVGEGDEDLAVAIEVRSRPDSRAAFRSLSTLAQFQTRELSYEQPALLVYAIEPGWLQVALRIGERVWVSADQLRLHPVELVVRDRLSYLQRQWDGRLWSEPDKALAAELPVAPGQEYSVRVTDAQRVQQRSWLRLEVYDMSECAGGKQPQVIARGWVPAHQANGEPLVWFYSRGC